MEGYNRGKATAPLILGMIIILSFINLTNVSLKL